MANVTERSESVPHRLFVVKSWLFNVMRIQELRPKTKEVRRRGKANLRVNAIRNNAVVKNGIVLWKLREKSISGSAR
jgi:hypothetical protein